MISDAPSRTLRAQGVGVVLSEDYLAREADTVEKLKKKGKEPWDR